MQTAVIVGLLIVAGVLDWWGWVALAAVYLILGYRYAKTVRDDRWRKRDWALAIGLWPYLRFIDWLSDQGRQ